MVRQYYRPDRILDGSTQGPPTLALSVSYPLGLSTCGLVLCPFLQYLCGVHYTGKLSCAFEFSEKLEMRL